MPTVRKYQPRAAPGQLPGVRAPRAGSAETFGAGVAEAAGDLTREVGKLMQDRQNEQREGRLMGAYAELGQQRLDIEQWAKQREGIDAAKLDVEKEALDSLDKKAEEIAKALPDDRLRQDFRKTHLSERESLQKGVRAHVGAQAEVVLDQEYKAARATAASQAAGALLPSGEVDPEAFGKAKKIGLDAVAARTKNWAPEAAAVERQAYLTELHQRVVRSIQANPNSGPVRAAAYLEFHAPEMDPAVAAQLRSDLRPAAIASKADAEATRILAATQDPEERLKLVDALEPEVGSKARQILREREAMAEAAKNDALNASRGILLNEIEKKTIRTVNDLEKNAEFSKLEARDPGRAAQVRNYLEAQTTQRRNLSLGERRAQASLDAQAEEWFERVIQTDPTQAAEIDLRGELAGKGVSDLAFKRLARRQTGIKAGVDKDGGVSESAFHGEVLRLGGPLVRYKDAFVAAMSKRRAKWFDGQTDKTKLPTDAEVQEWVAKELEWGDSTGGGLSRNRRRYENPPGEPFVPFPAEDQDYVPPEPGERGAPAALPPPPGARRAAPAKGPAAAPKPRTAADIPAAERAMIEAAMKKSGKKPSDPEIMRRYLLAHPEAR